MFPYVESAGTVETIMQEVERIEKLISIETKRELSKEEEKSKLSTYDEKYQEVVAKSREENSPKNHFSKKWRQNKNDDKNKLEL
jgi:thymidylate synthase